MQWAEEEVEAEKLLPKRKVKHHDVAIMRASKAAPDAASLPARRPRYPLATCIVEKLVILFDF